MTTALIPFLEHDDANRALMGSNMQAQAVPLLKPEPPLIGTGMERRVAEDTGDVILAENDGEVTTVDAEQIVVTHGSKRDEYSLHKFMRSNQGTIIHQRPIVSVGDKVKAGDVLCDGSSTAGGEIALGKNCLVAFMSWEGYNFEDAIIISERLVKQDELTSIHIEEYEIDARTTKLGDEEITRDIPNRSEESLRNLDERGIVRIGAEVAAGDLLVGKVTPKGETELTAEEKLIRAIFKEKAREVRDTSLKVPHGEGGVVIDVLTFSREAGDDLPPGVNDLVRVYVAIKRKIARGRQARRPPRQQGRDLEDRARGGHAVHGGRHSDRRDPQPARGAEPNEHRPDPRDASGLGRGQRLVRRRLGLLQGGTGGGRKDPRSNGGRVNVATPVFDGATVEDVDNALVKWQEENSERGIDLGIDKGERAGNRAEGKVQLYNGRTGEPYKGKVTIGYMYILKLLHLVDDKIHARSTGPYSLVTQQPLGGKAQFGGQRFGEMEVWALEAYGAAYTPAGDAHREVRRHRRPRQGLRVDRQGREHPRTLDSGVVQGPAQGDPVAGARRQRGLRGGRRSRDGRGGGRPPSRGRGTRHRAVRRARGRRNGAGDAKDEKEEQVVAEGDGGTDGDAEEAAKK